MFDGIRSRKELGIDRGSGGLCCRTALVDVFAVFRWGNVLSGNRAAPKLMVG